MSRTRPFLWVVFSALVAVVAGCGGGGSQSVGPGSPLAPATGAPVATNAAAPRPSGQSAGNVTASASFSLASLGLASNQRSAKNLNAAVGIVVYAYSSSGSAPTSLPTAQCSSTVPFSSSAGGCVGDTSTGTPSGTNTSICTAGGVCTLAFTAPIGTDQISIQLYSVEPTGCPSACTIVTTTGLVASGTTVATIGANGTNTVSLTINSAVATVSTTTTTALPPITPSASLAATISGGSLSFTLPACSTCSANTQASVSEVGSIPANIPFSVARAPQAAREPQSSAAPTTVPFVAGSGNTFVYGFGFTLVGATSLTSPLQVGATFTLTGTLATTFSTRTSGTLGVALVSGTALVSVGVVNYSYSAPTLTITDVGASGVTSNGVYILFLPPAGASPSPSPSPSASPVVTTPPGSSSTGSTGAIAVLTVNSVTYAFVPTSQGLLQVPITNAGGTALATSNTSSFSPVAAGSYGVDACAADGTHKVVYCISFNQNDANIYAYNVSGGTIASPTLIPTDASGIVSYSGGNCLLCGIVYDSVGPDVVVSVPSGYELYATTNTGGKPNTFVSVGRIAENFGFNASAREIFSPHYTSYTSSSGSGIDLINLSLASPGPYALASPPSGLAGPDHGAVDVTTNIGITTNEQNSSSGIAQGYLFNIGSATLGSSTFTTTVAPFTLTSAVIGTDDPWSTDGIAVDSLEHLAFFIGEFGSPAVVGVAKLPTSASALSTSDWSANSNADWVFAKLKSGFNESADPHALTVFNLPGVCADCAVVFDSTKTQLAIVDLNQLLAATRTTSPDTHTVASSVNLTTATSGNPVVTYLSTTGTGSASWARRPLAQPRRTQQGY